MHTIEQLEKQQVGLRLPRYLVEEIDSFTQQYAVNRTEIITEAIRSYIAQEKEKRLYEEFEQGAAQIKAIKEGKVKVEELGTLSDLINELENS